MKFKFIMIVLLCMTIPVWGVKAAVPELLRPELIENSVPLLPIGTGESLLGDASFFGNSLILDEPPVVMDQKIIDFLTSDDAIASEANASEIESEIQDDLLIPQEHHFWTGRTLLIGTGILLLTGLLVAILAMFSGSHGGHGSYGGGGSGPGSGGSGPNPNGGNPFPNNGPGPNFGGDPPKGPHIPPFFGFVKNPSGGDNFQNPWTWNGHTETIPHNPEPSSMLLLSIGLLLPKLKRRSVK